MSKNMRDQMPHVAEMVDHLREMLGKEFVDQQIRRSLRGEPTFFAEENGHQIGARNLEITAVVYWDESGNARSRDPDWMVDARKQAEQAGVAIRQHDPDNPNDVHREARELRAFLKERGADVCSDKK